MPNSLSFGKAVYLWRRARGLTQAALAERTELSRPNLSMIEQGARDVTLGTVRRLAGALNLSPGILVDGIGPDHSKREPIQRESLDRIGRFLLGEPIKLRAEEMKIAGLLRSIIKRKLGIAARQTRALPRTAREERKNWEELKILLRDEEINNLIKRVEKGSFSAG